MNNYFLNNKKYRDWELNQDDNEFQKFIGKIISNHLPISFLEGFDSLNKELAKNLWPKSPSFILTANLFYYDDLFNLYLLKNTKLGSKFYSVQHGGYYGIGKTTFSEIHQISISDKFLTWGWSNSNNPLKIFPQGVFIKSNWNGYSYDSEKILLVTLSVPRYSHEIFFGHISSSWLSYFNDQKTFVNNLKQSLREKLLVKLSSNDFGWYQKERWLDLYPNINIVDGTINQYIRKSKLIICTYNSTTYLEAIFFNVPTIIFWDPKYWEIRPEALPFIKLLIDSKILHESPESAAIHINSIYNNIESWWNSKKVRNALTSFSINFACKNKNLASTLKSF